MLRVLFTLAIMGTGNGFAGLLTLKEAESRALKNAYEMSAQYYEERAREWEKRNATANYLPDVSYTGTYMMMDKRTVDRANLFFESLEDPAGNPFTQIYVNAHRIDSMLNIPPAPPAGGMDFENPNPIYQNSFSHQISVVQPISNGGIELAAINIARHTKQAVDFQVKAVAQDVIRDTRKAYFDAIQALEMVAIAEKSLQFSRQNLKKTGVKHEQGMAPVTDLLRWETEVIEKESALEQAKAGAKVALLMLNQSMGIPTDKAETEPALEPVSLFEAWYDTGPVQTVKSVEMNPQLLSIKSYTKAAEGYKQVTLSGYFPKLNAFYTYNWPAWNKLQPWHERRGWTAGATLTVPLFSGLRNSTSYRQSSYEVKKVQIEERKIENQLKIVNIQKILFYQAAYNAVKGARKQHKLMEQQLAMMQNRYDGGLVNQNQLLEVSNLTDQSRMGYIQKLFNCLFLETEYQHNIGKLEVTK